MIIGSGTTVSANFITSSSNVAENRSFSQSSGSILKSIKNDLRGLFLISQVHTMWNLKSYSSLSEIHI